MQEAGRPIRYPTKIAPTLQELMSGVDGVMSGLRQMLQQHMAAGVKRLRVQVRTDTKHLVLLQSFLHRRRLWGQRPIDLQACREVDAKHAPGLTWTWYV